MIHRLSISNFIKAKHPFKYLQAPANDKKTYLYYRETLEKNGTSGAHQDKKCASLRQIVKKTIMEEKDMEYASFFIHL